MPATMLTLSVARAPDEPRASKAERHRESATAKSRLASRVAPRAGADCGRGRVVPTELIL